ncbi:hypothetical protein ABMA27_013098 [Loxostege sticticalis]|uniref:Metalloendopeptidase n=1 Tax=Loxostege sticticalis TaxID=481309 RepID=A0ABR3IE26_LOXSC
MSQDSEEVLKYPLTKWATSILQEGTSVMALQAIEPGYDLSDEEIKKLKLWPKGIIHYYIDTVSFDKVLRDRIRSYLDVFSGLTGVHFIEMHNLLSEEVQSRWVLFINRIGLLKCADSVNITDTGVQRVVLGYDCISQRGELGDVALAIVGVPPQHNAPDRDDYITVHMENVKPGKEHLFKKLSHSEWLFQNLNYDFSSVSHFHYHEHSVNGKATIVPKKSVTVQVGESEGLSYTDVLKVRMLYNYISRNKHSSATAQECHQIFRPGANFKKYKPKENDVQPREKPLEYLEANGMKVPENIPQDNQSEEKLDKVDEDGDVKKEYEIIEPTENQNEDEEPAQNNESRSVEELTEGTEGPKKVIDRYITVAETSAELLRKRNKIT